ncbi:MAG: Bro-N domain-containing protein [Acidobacteria bacterium]|nr:Bro-N domain-containing protein [Acidobacteriota bacterium]
MEKKSEIRLFEERKVRTIWNAETENWYFVISDVVQILTDTKDPGDYIKKMRKRDRVLAKGWGQIVTPLSVETPGGKQPMNCANTEGLLRIIQSIPSPKAEPFKLWLAQVGSERLEEMQDPELTIDRALEQYLKLGYSENWINQRLKSIEIRKELTDEWKRRGMKEGIQFATLTDIITKTWSGKNTKEYKTLKGLKKENLRDNMTNTELILNMLAEASTKDISQATEPTTFDENKKVAQQGGNVAKVARLELEEKTGKNVVTELSAKAGLKQIAAPKR